MNKYQSTLLEIKKVLGLAEVKVELGSIKMVDGTEIKYDKLEVGGLVTIVSEDGTEAPVPAGTYELEDGYVIEVDEAGIITKYDVKPEAEEAAEEASVEQSTEVETALADEAPETEARLIALEERIAALEQALADSLGLSKSIAESTQELSKQVAMAASAAPLKRTPSETKNNDLFNDNIKQIAKTLEGLKKSK
jgi:uncharacterized coiled-coil protein SlyX